MASTEKEPCVVPLICSSGFYGAEKVVSNLCQDPNTKHMVVLCLSNPNNTTSTFKRSVTPYGVEFFSSKNSTKQAIKALIELAGGYESIVIHAHGYKEIFIACLFQQFKPCKIIVTQHGFTARNFKSKCYNWVNLALCRWGKIEAVVCVTQAIYHRYHDFGVPKQRLILLPNGISISTRLDNASARAQMAARYGLPLEVPIVLYAGRLSDEKDPLLFADIVQEMSAAQASFCAVIAGEGPLEKQMIQRLDGLFLTGRAKMLGFVENMDTLLAAADVLVLTSKTEGTPMIVLEAMAQGCPVIAANVGGLSEIIKSNQDGLLVDSRDPVQYSTRCIELLGDVKKLKSISENAYRKVQTEYALTKQYPIYQRLYGSSR
jgi:glycosyltransferase involved in cell wall biosynthesis